MREIKFRAWDLNEDEYISWDKLIRKRYNQDFIQDNENPNGPILNLMTDKHLILEQFTGLKDKNGKEIYESDIVLASGWNPSRFEIRFIEGGFCGWCDYLELPTDIYLWYDSLGCHIEVIGNVHENTELLNDRS